MPCIKECAFVCLFSSFISKYSLPSFKLLNQNKYEHTYLVSTPDQTYENIKILVAGKLSSDLEPIGVKIVQSVLLTLLYHDQDH